MEYLQYVCVCVYGLLYCHINIHGASGPCQWGGVGGITQLLFRANGGELEVVCVCAEKVTWNPTPAKVSGQLG